ncbi:LytR C-terminal domain-containing protein [Agromyces soli]|uniref:LytR C-terminal domain-containing protein n=1 Tax=Agromyces soli TaxID=659012 RepID=A0ABY4ANI4_9MICO|nr:LytR C-terminal domain-containing protein [Agromyces soli]UOE24730.1 LytR C-terminal domain-containing protein [Agromyces soli]
MAQNFPRDRFDSLPNGIDRVGAHRAPERRGRGWLAFGIAALVTLVLVAAGIIGLMVFNGRLDFAEPSAPPQSDQPVETAVPTVAPDVPVLVLNGTDASGLAATASEALQAAGVPVSSAANASEDTIETTIVYYASEELEGAARGVLGALGVGDVGLDPSIAETGGTITVVLGADYAAANGG